MNKLQRADLWNVKDYALRRDGFRTLVIAHKSQRRIALGAHATLLFEDFLTMKYQVQEMLRAERIFEVAGIQEEIDAYNPLVPDGANWKATMLIEYDDVDERRRSLAQLAGVEHRMWAQIAGTERVCAIANEDLDRSTTEKTLAMHFLRFELPPAAVNALRAGAALSMGIDDPRLPCATQLSPASRAALLADLD